MDAVSFPRPRFRQYLILQDNPEYSAKDLCLWNYRSHSHFPMNFQNLSLGFSMS